MNPDTDATFSVAESGRDRADTPETVVVLLASYQGARFLPAQLDSIAEQRHRDWRLLVSDDGSQDGTCEIVSSFACNFPAEQVQLIEGPRLGATQNFLHLLQQAPAGCLLAFCDQDDVWFPDKLSRAVAQLRGADGPAHYAARTVITAQDLTPVTESRRFLRPFGFRNAVVQACMAGNTSVFNPAAANLLRKGATAARQAGVESHDWWAYQLTSGAGATLIHDPEPALLYRQHQNSEMGRNDTPRAMASRLGQLFAGDYGGWLSSNLVALGAVRDLLTPENRAVLDEFAATLQMTGPEAALKMRGIRLYRHTRAGTAALFAAAALGRLRQPRSPNT